MRSHSLVLAALAVMTGLGAVAAPVTARGVNDANENPSSLEILSSKIPSNIRFEATAFVMPSQSNNEERQSQGTGVELTRTGDEDTTVLRTHDAVPLGRGDNRNSTLLRPLLAGAGRQASPFPGGGGGSGGRFAAPAGGALPFAHHDNGADGAEAAPTQPPQKRADNPLAGVQDLPATAIKLSNAPVPPEAAAMPAAAMKQAAAAIPDNPSPADAVAATRELQEMPARAMKAAGGMIPAAAAARPQKQRRGNTGVRLPALDVEPAAAETDALGLQILDGETAGEPRKRATTRVALPALDIDPAAAETDALGLQILDGETTGEPRKRATTRVTLPAVHMKAATVNTNALGVHVLDNKRRRDRENTAEGCRRHAAELAPPARGDNPEPALVQIRPVAHVEPVATLGPAADIKLPLSRTLGLSRRQVKVKLLRPRPGDALPPVIVAPHVRPAINLQQRAMRRGVRATAE